MLNIFKLANFEKHFYYDPKNKNMLLFLNTYEPTNDVLYLAITPNYMTKEYGVINQIVTISKFKKEDYKSRIKTLIKLRRQGSNLLYYQPKPVCLAENYRLSTLAYDVIIPQIF